LEARIWIRIRIKVKGRIQIRIKVTSRIRIRVKVTSRIRIRINVLRIRNNGWYLVAFFQSSSIFDSVAEA
jgi:hypothetical protein